MYGFRALLLVMLLQGAPAIAQEASTPPPHGETAVISLIHRPAAEVAGLLGPLLLPGEVAIPDGDRLVVRATARRIGEITALARELDRPPRLLRVSVRQRPFGATADAGSRVWSTADTSIPVTRVQMIEGRPAWVRIGQRVPVGESRLRQVEGQWYVEDSVRYRTVTSGFFVEARVIGEQARVTINPQLEGDAPEAGGRFDLQRLHTTLVVPLAQWISLGGGGTEPLSATWSTRDNRGGELEIRVEVIDSSPGN